MAENLRIERREAHAAWPEVEALSEIVYTPEMLAHSEFHDVDWSRAERWILGYAGDVLVGSAGIHRRQVHVDGATMTIAGIGGVKTHPDYQKRGIASAMLDDAKAVIDADIAPDFSLIFVESHNRAFYGKRGWRVFEGAVMVEQHGERLAFPEGGAMVRDGAEPAPLSGTIDLNGKPW
ncbi:MAG: GNAT family N-acetyltransferase [Pseudomonadota bacterium]